MTPILELRNITKRFGSLVANDHINLELQPGEIHALLGENGAGKTTLMNILYGLYRADEGEILIRGKPVLIDSPQDAIEAGIGMIHQHFMLVPVFTVTENIMLGAETTYGAGVLNTRAVAERIQQISDEYGFQVNPNSTIKDLPVGVQQRVEIIKLLYRSADILVLDEPTAVLTPQEVRDLFKIIHNLVDQGKSIIFITHKLAEVLEIADRITVIRRGEVVGTVRPDETSQEQLAAMMVGHEVKLEMDRPPQPVGQPVLKVQNLFVADDREHITVSDVSFEVREGEILGIAGVQGNGQTELVEALTGLRRPVSGTIELLGENVTHAPPRRILEHGTAHIPEDRQRDGLVLSFPIRDNLILSNYYRQPFARQNVMRWDVVEQTAEDLIRAFDVRTLDPLAAASTLSGGNQQKLIVARELSRPIKLVIASQPTRGVDVGSIENIHNNLLDKRARGIAILLVSTELDEILQLADRVAVMFRGRILAILPSDQATRENVGLLMAGITPQTGAPVAAS